MHSDFGCNLRSIVDRFSDDFLNPQNFKNNDFPFVFVSFWTNRPFEVNIYFKSNLGANLLPFCLRKSIKIDRKVDPKSNPKFDRFVDRFFNDFGSIWGAKLRPCWRHFWQNRGGLVKCSCVRCCVVVFFRILVCLGRVWTLLGSILAPFGLHFGSIWAPFWLPLGSICCHLRAGGNTRSERNLHKCLQQGEI